MDGTQAKFNGGRTMILADLSQARQNRQSGYEKRRTEIKNLKGVENFLRKEAAEHSNVDEMLNELYWDRMHQKITKAVEERNGNIPPWRSTLPTQIRKKIKAVAESLPFISGYTLLNLVFINMFFDLVLKG